MNSYQQLGLEKARCSYFRGKAGARKDHTDTEVIIADDYEHDENEDGEEL